MMNCYQVGRIAPVRGWRMPRHRHPQFHEIVIIVQGELRAELAGRTVVGRPGQALLYPRNQPHAERAVGNKPLETFFFGFDDPDVDVTDWPRVLPDRTGHVLQATQWLLEIFNSANPDAHTQAARLVEVILFGLRHSAEAETPVSRVIRHIHYHLAEPMTLDALADVAAMSRFHFARTFLHATGQSPMHYLRARRVEAARYFLTTSTLPLRSIAPQVGLVDQAHLTRVFTRVTGCLPSEVRRTQSF